MLLSTWKSRSACFVQMKTTFFIENNIAYVVFNFTLTFSLGGNNLSHNVTLSINKRVKDILTRFLIFVEGRKILISCVCAWPSSSGITDWMCRDDDGSVHNDKTHRSRWSSQWNHLSTF